MEQHITDPDASSSEKSLGPPGALRITWEPPGGGRRTVEFSASFCAGREESCEVQLGDSKVSNRHAAFYHTSSGWWVRDLGSTNGTFLNGERIQNAPINGAARLQLAAGGPELELVLAVPSVAGASDPSHLTMPAFPVAPDIRPVPLEEANPSVSQIINKYSGSKPTGRDSTQTRLLRQAFQRVKAIQSRRYWIAIAAVGVLLAAVAGIAIYQNLRLKKLTTLGVGIFYEMKALEIQIKRSMGAVEATNDAATLREAQEKQKQLDALRERYDGFVAEIGVLGDESSEEDRLIFRVARLFGECELNVPEDFAAEVKRFIEKWRSTTRLQDCIRRVENNDYAMRAYRSLIANHLPPQFLYLALQESDFKQDAIGPRTRFGIAKGFWQFMPDTASQYGLRLGPLLELPAYDPRDERFDFDKASRAASRYLTYIYTTEAEASGLLVMASYNWGHNVVRKHIREMPDNPRERNFWKLLESQTIPAQTYDYVFYIFAAAVIGENPRLFGFTFDNPLQRLADAS